MGFAMMKILESEPRPNSFKRDKYKSEKPFPTSNTAKFSFLFRQDSQKLVFRNSVGF